MGSSNGTATDDVLNGRYVLVRCSDAGVHAGELVSRKGRECVLRNARRLWYWKPATGAFLSSVSERGLGPGCKIGEPQRLLLLTENCEIALCSDEAAASIANYPAFEPAENHYE